MSNDKKKSGSIWRNGYQATTNAQSEFLSHFLYSALGLHCVLCTGLWNRVCASTVNWLLYFVSFRWLFISVTEINPGYCIGTQRNWLKNHPKIYYRSFVIAFWWLFALHFVFVGSSNASSLTFCIRFYFCFCTHLTLLIEWTWKEY